MASLRGCIAGLVSVRICLTGASMRYINRIFTVHAGQPVDNADLRPYYQRCIDGLPIPPAERATLDAFVRYNLNGQRSRHIVEPLESLGAFASRATVFQAGADRALSDLAAQIGPAAEAAGVTFDAVITTTSSGNLMPGLSYRLAHRLPTLVRPNAMLLDLGNMGCTGSLQALNVTRCLDTRFSHVLIVSVELPTTLFDGTSDRLDVWQGNCTFGDGAAALWVSSRPDADGLALALEDLRSEQRADVGLDLIRWTYRHYYTFTVADDDTFARDVRAFVTSALTDAELGWRGETRWAIHPAGIALLVRLSRQLGLPSAAMQPTVQHFRRYSNMSSASIVFILKDVAAETPVGSAINLLTMGAGFSVVYGRLRRGA
jgi:alkylresorcinol/alkylpyrone synthase